MPDVQGCRTGPAGDLPMSVGRKEAPLARGGRQRARMRRRLLPLMLASAVTVGCSTYDRAAAPARSATTARPFADRVTDLPMDNVGRIGDGLWRGGAPDEAGLRALAERGFRTVVNLRSSHSYRAEAEALGLSVVEIPMRADLTCTPPDEAAVRRFLDTVTDPANQPVYFHCAQGKDRTGTMAAVYRMEVCGWTPDEALEEMRAFGCHDWYRDFLEYVRTYRCRDETTRSSFRP